MGADVGRVLGTRTSDRTGPLPTATLAVDGQQAGLRAYERLFNE